jgi:MarR family transcriptional regulator, organic hydroperoxide resistance regulator
MDSPSQSALDEQLASDTEAVGCIALHLSWIAQRGLSQELTTFHLTVPQFMALTAIRRHGGGCNMSTLAGDTYQVLATMTGIMDRLVERDLVERQRDISDRRAVRVALTEAGEQLLKRVEHRKQARLERTLAHLSVPDRQELLRLMALYLHATLLEAHSSIHVADLQG